mmetsp:Transcript_5210/g.11024  ORF Transcript_5210/g.11024 Transcript_5210/m.11024 type:complete len:215 (+) Transcript_5210:50-694(+)
MSPHFAAVLPHDILLVDEEPVLSPSLPHRPHKVFGVDPFVELQLVPLLKPRSQLVGPLLQPVMRDLGEEEVVHDVPVHHVVRPVVNPSVVPVHGLEPPPNERPRVVGVQLSVWAVVLQVSHHKEPHGHDAPRDDANGSEGRGPHGRQQGGGEGDAHKGGQKAAADGRVRLTLPHSPVRNYVAAVGDAGEEVHEVQDRQLKHAGLVREVHPPHSR